MSIPLTDNNPLYHSEFLLGPVETIVCSHRALAFGHLSAHDIMEAYRTLSMRIRRSSRHLSIASNGFPALEPLRDKGTEVVTALRRDVSRALRIPGERTSSDPSLGSPCPRAEAVGWESTTCYANSDVDSSTLCHYALRLLSEIFRFPVLSSVFPPQDLGHLLGDVISIIRRPHLRIRSPNISKTGMLLSWVLRTQRLPKEVLLSRIEDVILYLNFILEAAVRDTTVVVIVVDALNCIVNLLTFHQHILVTHLAGLLPSIFPFAIHPSSELRHHAAVVLASFSYTLITHPTLIAKDTIEAICVHTHSFLTPETTRHPTSSRKLPPLLDAAVSSKTFGSVGGNSPWALTVVASFVVLLGPSLFMHHGPLKLVMNISQKALRHRPGRDLNPHVWRTFIWSMTQLYMQRSSNAKGGIEIVQRCVLVLKQALHAGLGAALISSLLEATPTDTSNETRLRWAIPSVFDILCDMLSSNYQDIRDEAYRIFECLTGRIEATSDPQRETGCGTDALLSRFLFDGSLLHADKIQVEEVAGSTPVFSPRPLSREEILTHWDPVSSCFVLVARNSFKDDNVDLMTKAIPIWQSLLLARAQPIQGHALLAVSADFGPQLTSLLSQFLPDHLPPLSGEAESIETQLRSLIISRQLWTVAQDVFPQSWLEPVAASFLTAIFQRVFHLADQRVLTNWSSLCSALIVVGIPNVLESISHQDEARRGSEIKRQLWRLMAMHCASSTPSNLQNLTLILVFPIGSWSMSEDDLGIWERVLEQHLSVTDKPVKTVDIVESVASKCPEIGPSFSTNTALRIALAILRFLNFNKGDSTIPTKTFSYLNATLTASYPPQSTTADTTYRLLKEIHHMILSMPASLLESVISAIQPGLVVWIEDTREFLSAKQYIDLLMPLYDSLLLRLQSLPISITSLNALVPLLTSPFSRVPPPMLGPAAFQRFFYAVHSRLALPTGAYSGELCAHLDACVRVFGGKWPSDMTPLSPSSQTKTQLHMDSGSINETPVVPMDFEGAEEQIPHARSIEHEVVPDSQCVILNTSLCASSQTRSIAGVVQDSSRPLSSAFPHVRTRPSPTHLISDSSKESPKTLESSSPYTNSLMKRRHIPQELPAAKRRCAAAPPSDRLRTRSAPLTRVSSPVPPSPRSPSTPGASRRNRLVMECVEVTPLRELLHRREADAERNKMRGQNQRNGLDDHAWEVTPERPFLPGVTQKLSESDEIVPETPDAILRPTRTSLPTDKESSPGNGSPTRSLGQAQPRVRARTTSTRLAAALDEVDDVFSRPGLSQIPVEELADSAQLLDAAERQLRRAWVRSTSKNVMVQPT